MTEQQSDVLVKLDDRVRLMSAVLAATQYPEKAQKLKPHGTHVHARSTRKYLNDHTAHPAVQATQGLLDQGTPIEALFALVWLMNWPDLSIAHLPTWAPPKYNEQLRDFYEKANLAHLWERDHEMWHKAETQAKTALKSLVLRPFFQQFVEEMDEALVFIPNISYPTDYDLGFKLGEQLIAIIPPPLAWGDSPPWPYDEATMLTPLYRSAISVFGKEIIKAYLRKHMAKFKTISENELPLSDQFKAQYPTWEDQFTTLFLTAAVAIYLEDNADEKEHKAFVMMEKKLRGMSILPGTVSVLRHFLQEKGTNDKYSTLIEFLPIFSRQLRVAQKIVRF